MCTEPLLHIGHCFVINLPLEARKCVLGLDRCVSDPDIGFVLTPPMHWLPPQSGHAPPRSMVHCSSGVHLSPPPHRRGRSLGHCCLR